MNRIKKIFGGVNLTWPGLIIFAVIAGVYTAVMAILPITTKTSFADISISFEVWILFGIFIIMNSKSAMDSALKCFIFFLISQPLVYLIQVPFSALGFGIFTYYKRWFIWTLFTIPMGFIGYYMKKDKWWGIIILAPILLFLGFHYYDYFTQFLADLPHHLLSMLFCFITLLLYPICIFNDKKAKITGIIISVIIIIGATIVPFTYSTTMHALIMTSDAAYYQTFNDKYNVYLENDKLGNVYIVYDEDIENYEIKADFKKMGKTNLIIEDEYGNKTVYELNISKGTYSLTKK